MPQSRGLPDCRARRARVSCWSNTGQKYNGQNWPNAGERASGPIAESMQILSLAGGLDLSFAPPSRRGTTQTGYRAGRARVSCWPNTGQNTTVKTGAPPKLV